MVSVKEKKLMVEANVVYVTHVTLISLLSPIQGDWHMDSGLTIVLGIIGLITLYLHIMWMSALDGVSIGTRTRMLVA